MGFYARLHVTDLKQKGTYNYSNSTFFYILQIDGNITDSFKLQKYECLELG